MSIEAWLERFGRGWRGPLLAALVVLAAGLPGLLALPPLDRDESRFAEATAQMLETGDFVSPMFQDTPRYKKPVGVYWLQAASVAALSHVEDRQIWAYRIPSLLGAMLAAAACAWGAAAFLEPGYALLAGAMLGSTFLLSMEASIAATDGVLAGAVTLAMAALGRLYLAARGGPPANVWVKVLFWAGMALSILVKGPIGPMVAGLTMIALMAWDRKAVWLAHIGWGWGLLGIAAVVGPWALAVTVASDGSFWGASRGGDLAPKLLGGQEGHGEPPGYYILLAPLMLFPAVLLAPSGVSLGWRNLRTAWRSEGDAGVRFALCWLIPTWLVFEAVPTKLIHYPLPLYGALAWLMAAAVGPLAAVRFDGGHDMFIAAIAGVLYLVAGAAGAWWLLRGSALKALLVGGAVALIAHGLLLGMVAPSLRSMWLSSRAARALAAAGASPRQGVISGPVTVAGYEEPSLVFLLGSDTQLGDASDAAQAIVDGRPALVEQRQDSAFEAALKPDDAVARRVGEGAGVDYSNGHHDVLQIFLPVNAPASEAEP